MGSHAVLSTLAIVILAGITTVSRLSGGEPGRTPISGWRTDTSGCYPDATPPLHWAGDKAFYKVDLPGTSAVATPIIVGERLFVMAEPNWIYCLSKADGAVLWKREMKIEEITLKDSLEEITKLAQARHPLWEKENALKAEKAKVDAALKEKPDDQALKDKATALGAEIATTKAQREKLPKGECKPGKSIGYTTCTPVSNGALVFCFLHNGMGWCFDLEGKVKWSRMVYPCCMGYGQSMSPALAGDTIGINVDERFFALDLASGATLWQAQQTQHQGSPIAIKVSDKPREQWVFLGTHGHVWDARTGTCFTVMGFPAMNLFGTPALVGGTAYWVSENRMWVRCAFESDGKGGVLLRKGQGNLSKGCYYASLLLADGLLYAWNNVDYGHNKKILQVLDPKDGKTILELNQADPGGPRVGGWAYPSPTAAGRFVFVGGDSGQFIVYAPVQEQVEQGADTITRFALKEVACNALGDAVWSCPVFERDRLYIRSFKALYCFQASEEDRREAAKWFPAKP